MSSPLPHRAPPPSNDVDAVDDLPEQDPPVDEAARLTRWAWGCIGSVIVFAVVLLLVFTR